MPDYNKGDFTQQGVAGHVNANLRLNEKRLVNIDLTSNEEAEGCTIAGTVKDLLNDKVYPIGSGVSGNIEITENGENINVAPYATATVNVAGGGGGLPMLHLTAHNNTNKFATWLGTFIVRTIPDAPYGVVGFLTIGTNETLNTDLFYIAEPGDPVIYAVTIGWYNDFDATVSFAYSDLVNCTFDADSGSLIITDPSQDASATVDVILTE